MRERKPMRRVLALGLAAALLAWPHETQTQTGDDEGAKNAKKGLVLLETLILKANNSQLLLK